MKTYMILMLVLIASVHASEDAINHYFEDNGVLLNISLNSPFSYESQKLTAGEATLNMDSFVDHKVQFDDMEHAFDMIIVDDTLTFAKSRSGPCSDICIGGKAFEEILTIEPQSPVEVLFDASSYSSPLEQDRIVIKEIEGRLVAISRSDATIQNGDIVVKQANVATSTLFMSNPLPRREVDVLGDGVLEIFTKQAGSSIRMFLEYYKDYNVDDSSRYYSPDNSVEVILEEDGGWHDVVPAEGTSCDESSLCSIAYDSTRQGTEMCFCTQVDGRYGYRNKRNEWCNIALNEPASCREDGKCYPLGCSYGASDPDCSISGPDDKDYGFCTQEEACRISNYATESKCRTGSLLQDPCMQGISIEPSQASCRWEVAVKEISCQEIEDQGLEEGKLYVQVLDARHEPLTGEVSVSFNSEERATRTLQRYPVCDADIGQGFAVFDMGTGSISVKAQSDYASSSDVLIVGEDYPDSVCGGLQEKQSLFVRYVERCPSVCGSSAPQDPVYEEQPLPVNGCCPEGYHYCGPDDIGECGDADHPEFRDRCWPIVYTNENGPECTSSGGVLRQAWLSGPHQSEEFMCPFTFYNGEEYSLQNSKIYWFACDEEPVCGEAAEQKDSCVGNCGAGFFLLPQRSSDYIDEIYEFTGEGGWALVIGLTGANKEEMVTFIEQADTRGINTVMRVLGPDWERTIPSPEQMGHFIREIYEDTEGRLHYVQIWNEPNIVYSDAEDSFSSEEYAAYFIDVAQEIDDLAIQVVPAALSAGESYTQDDMERKHSGDYMESMFAYPGFLDQADLLAHHAYSLVGPNDFDGDICMDGSLYGHVCMEGMPGYQYTLSKAHELSGEEFQVLITETGYPVDHPDAVEWNKQIIDLFSQDDRVMGTMFFLLNGDIRWSDHSWLDLQGRTGSIYEDVRKMCNMECS